MKMSIHSSQKRPFWQRIILDSQGYLNACHSLAEDYIFVHILNFLYTISIFPLTQYKYLCLGYLYAAEQGSRSDTAVPDVAVEDVAIELQNNKATKLVSTVVIFSKPV